MIDNFVTVLLGYQVLTTLNFLVYELDHLASIHIHHMIVVVVRRHLENRIARLEVMPDDQPRAFKLCEYPIHRRQADIFARVA